MQKINHKTWIIGPNGPNCETHPLFFNQNKTYAKLRSHDKYLKSYKINLTSL